MAAGRAEDGGLFGSGGSEGWQGDDGVHQAVCAPPPLHLLSPPPPTAQRKLKRCAAGGEAGGDLERDAGGWGLGALELITE